MRLEKFRVTNFRNIKDSGWIEDLTQVTAFVGQNEAGKSNLFEALYQVNPILEGGGYDASDDWPKDDWKNRENAEGEVVCQAVFWLSKDEIEDLIVYAHPKGENGTNEISEQDIKVILPTKIRIVASRGYGGLDEFALEDDGSSSSLDQDRVAEWVNANLPKFVLMTDHSLTGTQTELDQLKARLDQNGGNRNALDQNDQTIMIILELAKIDLAELITKGSSADGRTERSYDTLEASSYLSQEFKKLWSQKSVRFDIKVDGTTLNIFVVDEAIGVPVKLERRSTGFRWHVTFAWKLTHASDGAYKNCILLLEEPCIHLHYDGQRDLLQVFEDLSENNMVLYTTHLASMVDQSNPERVRIVEQRKNNIAVKHGVVSDQRAPMAVIEMALGLTGDLGGMLGQRKVLIVEGGTDSLIINKLSGLMKADGQEGLSDHIYLWPSDGASKTPMFAAFAIGQGWDAAVLLDKDGAGTEAAKKIKENYLDKIAKEEGQQFKILTLDKAAGIKQTDVAIEDIFPADFYLGCVNRAYGYAISIEDLPEDGSSEIADRIEQVLRNKYNLSGLDKKLVLAEMLRVFDTWEKFCDLPKSAQTSAKKLIKSINDALAPIPESTKATAR